jgi:hypothetical protein
MLKKEFLWCIDGLPIEPITWEPATHTIYHGTTPVINFSKSTGFREITPGVYSNPDEPGGIVVIYKNGSVQIWSSFKSDADYFIINGILIAYREKRRTAIAWDIGTRSLIGTFELGYDKSAYEFFLAPDNDFDPFISHKVVMSSKQTGILSIGGREVALLTCSRPAIEDGTFDVMFGTHFRQCIGTTDVFVYHDGSNWIMHSLFTGLKTVVDAGFVPKNRNGGVFIENMDALHLGLYIDKEDDMKAGGTSGFILLDSKDNMRFAPINRWWASVTDDGASPLTRVTLKAQ